MGALSREFTGRPSRKRAVLLLSALVALAGAWWWSSGPLGAAGRLHLLHAKLILWERDNQWGDAVQIPMFRLEDTCPDQRALAEILTAESDPVLVAWGLELAVWSRHPRAAAMAANHIKSQEWLSTETLGQAAEEYCLIANQQQDVDPSDAELQAVAAWRRWYLSTAARSRSRWAGSLGP